MHWFMSLRILFFGLEIFWSNVRRRCTSMIIATYNVAVQYLCLLVDRFELIDLIVSASSTCEQENRLQKRIPFETSKGDFAITKFN